MAVEDERLSDTDINSDSDKSQEEFISLTDVNSDSNGSFIVVDSDNQYMKVKSFKVIKYSKILILRSLLHCPKVIMKPTFGLIMQEHWQLKMEKKLIVH